MNDNLQYSITYRSFNTSIPGKVPFSIYSSIAPPPVDSKHEIDVTGCGDAFTSGVFFYELLHQEEYSCRDLKIAKYLAGLKSIYPFSNLCGIDNDVLKYIIEYVGL